MKNKREAYTKIFTSINLRYFQLVFLFGILFSCQSADEHTVPGDIKTLKSPKAKSHKPKALNEETAVGFLEEYESSLEDSLVVISTSFGDITIKLYDNTPLHKANFRYLIERDYFDNTWFYRVSKGHVVQAGNTDGRETVYKREAVGEYRIPAEMIPTNYHKYGAVAEARSYAKNPQKKSDPYEFYIVLGKAYTRGELQLLAEKHNFELTPAALDFYGNRRGSPHLDGQHTVFGEVIDGMDVVEKISLVEVDEGEWPLINIPLKISLKEQ